jgi:hypothetical protein
LPTRIIRICEYFEMLIPLEPFSFGLRNQIAIDSGEYVHVSVEAGLGVEIDLGLLDNHLICRVWSRLHPY